MLEIKDISVAFAGLQARNLETTCLVIKMGLSRLGEHMQKTDTLILRWISLIAQCFNKLVFFLGGGESQYDLVTHTKNVKKQNVYVSVGRENNFTRKCLSFYTNDWKTQLCNLTPTVR